MLAGPPTTPAAPPRRSRRPPSCVAALLLPATLGLAACASHQPKPAPSRALGPVTTLEHTPAASPIVLGGENGLELAWWVVSADDETLAPALAPYLDEPVPIGPDVRAVWQANGLRLVAVPLDRLQDLRDSLPVLGAVQRQWLGQVPLWTDAVHGPTAPDGAVIALDTGRLILGPGRLRLLARCWTVPVAPPSPDQPQHATAALHIELLPQHQEDNPHRSSVPSIDPVPLPLAPEDEGLLFRRLLATFSVPQGYAYLIIPASPGAPWHAAAAAGAPSPADEPAASASLPAPPPPPRVGQVTRESAAASVGAGSGASRPGAPAEAAGPPGPRGPRFRPALTLGQAMLCSGALKAPGSTAAADPHPVRAIILLIPRVPARFDLLPE